MTEGLRIGPLAAEAAFGPLSRSRNTSAVAPGGRSAPVPVVAPDDADLARRCVAGEDAAQREFVERYARIVLSVCRRKGLAPDDAEDVTQEVLSDAFRGLASYRGDARLSTWLFTLACRRVAGHYRSESRRPRASGHPGDASFPADPADHGWQTRLEDADRAARARRVIETLPEPTRTILVAYHVAELSVREIADELDLPEGSVKSHLHRGRLAVRRRMESP